MVQHAAIQYMMPAAIGPPLDKEFLVATPTIPATKINNPANSPCVPPVSPLEDITLSVPTTHY